MSDLPPSLDELVQRVHRHDPPLATRTADTLGRLLRAAQSLAWARDQAPDLARAATPDGVLQVVVERARALTGAPEVWALSWTRRRGGVTVRALAGDGPRIDGQLVQPATLSHSLVGQVADEGRPAWSDDAASDARYASAQSIARLELRSVGCLPLGPDAVLYLADPDTPGRFTAAHRSQLSALCSLAAAFLAPRDVAPEPPVQALPGIVGTSAPMQALSRTVRAFAPLPWPLLILGETGTGKELVARAAHRLGPTATGPFVAGNAGAIPDQLGPSTLFGHVRGAFTGADRDTDGWVGRAQGGTLFLDEVGELSADNQVRLLRLLQEGTYQRVGESRERRFEGRIIAATHRAVDDPDSGFRADLYHRLSTTVVRLPPLRERHGDVGPLARHALAEAAEQLGRDPFPLSPAAEAELGRRPWPGNVRELVNVMRRATAQALAAGADGITPEHLGAPVASAAAAVAVAPPVGDLAEATERFQEDLVRRALQEAGGNKSEAARRLGVSRQWLHRLLGRWA